MSEDCGCHVIINGVVAVEQMVYCDKHNPHCGCRVIAGHFMSVDQEAGSFEQFIPAAKDASDCRFSAVVADNAELRRRAESAENERDEMLHFCAQSRPLQLTIRDLQQQNAKLEQERDALLEPLIQRFEKALVESDTSTMRIALGDRILTWHDILAEVKAKTEFGLRYARALCESAINSAITLQQYREERDALAGRVQELTQGIQAALSELGEPRYYNAKSRAVTALQSALLQETP